MLPFAEDIREFPFPSFSRFPASWKPDEQQQAVADNFVKMLDLAPSPKEEVLKPELTPNPVLQVKPVFSSCFWTIISCTCIPSIPTRYDGIFYVSYQRFYEYLELKSRSADAALPPVDEAFKKIMEQDQELSSSNKSIMDAVRGSFEVKENPKVCFVPHESVNCAFSKGT